VYLRIVSTTNEIQLDDDPPNGVYQIPITTAWKGPVRVQFLTRYDRTVYRTLHFTQGSEEIIFDLSVGDVFNFSLTQGGKPVSWNP